MTTTFGWRIWTLGADGCLKSPFRPAATRCGTMQAICEACGDDPPAPGCLCGIHYIPNVGDFLKYFYVLLAHMQQVFKTDGDLPFVPTFGLALGGAAVDPNTYQSTLRARRFHLLAMVLATPEAGRRAELADRFNCQVLVDHDDIDASSFGAWHELSSALESYTSGKLAEVASRPAAPLTTNPDTLSGVADLVVAAHGMDPAEVTPDDQQALLTKLQRAAPGLWW